MDYLPDAIHRENANSAAQQAEIDRLRAVNARLEDERDALAAAMPSEGADCALAYAALKTVNARLVEALQYIAGEKQPLDNMLGDKEIARIALYNERTATAKEDKVFRDTPSDDPPKPHRRSA